MLNVIAQAAQVVQQQAPDAAGIGAVGGVLGTVFGVGAALYVLYDRYQSRREAAAKERVATRRTAVEVESLASEMVAAAYERLAGERIKAHRDDVERLEHRIDENRAEIKSLREERDGCERKCDALTEQVAELKRQLRAGGSLPPGTDHHPALPG